MEMKAKKKLCMTRPVSIYNITISMQTNISMYRGEKEEEGKDGKEGRNIR